MPSAGPLRNRVILQTLQPSRDSFGDTIKGYANWATVWAAVEPLTGNERFQSVEAQDLASVNYRIRIRHREGVNHQMRVFWKGRTFDIKAVIPLEERQREMHLLCEELPGVD